MSNYSFLVSKAKALELLKENYLPKSKLPEAGWETCIGKTPAYTNNELSSVCSVMLSCTACLYLGNSGGRFYLSCISWPKDHWQSVFYNVNFCGVLKTNTFVVLWNQENLSYLVYNADTLEVLARYYSEASALEAITLTHQRNPSLKLSYTDIRKLEKNNHPLFKFVGF